MKKLLLSLLLSTSLFSTTTSAQESHGEAVNGPNVDVVIDGIPYDYYDFGSTLGIMDSELYVVPGQEGRFYSIQSIIDQGEVLRAKNNGLTAYFGHNNTFFAGQTGDLLNDGIFSLIKDIEVGDVIYQDGKEFIIEDEIFFTFDQTNVENGDLSLYRGYPLNYVVYNWPFEEEAVSIQFCVSGGMKTFFAYPNS